MIEKTFPKIGDTMKSSFFLDGLALMFIAFKLLDVTAVAQWSWWLVLLPIIAQLGLALLILTVTAFAENQDHSGVIATGNPNTVPMVLIGLTLTVVVLAFFAFA